MLNFCLLPTEIFSKRRKIYAIWAEGLRYKLMNSLVWLTFSWAMPKQLEARLIFRQKTSRPDIATGLHDFETAFCKNVSMERGRKHKSIGKIPHCHRHHDCEWEPAPSLVSKKYLLWLTSEISDQLWPFLSTAISCWMHRFSLDHRS